MGFFFFKQKTAYEMRISDWSSDVCSSDLVDRLDVELLVGEEALLLRHRVGGHLLLGPDDGGGDGELHGPVPLARAGTRGRGIAGPAAARGEEDRKSVVWGKGVAGRLRLGGGGSIKKQKNLGGKSWK